jgi:hypothetical protein
MVSISVKSGYAVPPRWGARPLPACPPPVHVHVHEGGGGVACLTSSPCVACWAGTSGCMLALVGAPSSRWNGVLLGTVPCAKRWGGELLSGVIHADNALHLSDSSTLCSTTYTPAHSRRTMRARGGTYLRGTPARFFSALLLSPGLASHTRRSPAAAHAAIPRRCSATVCQAKDFARRRPADTLLYHGAALRTSRFSIAAPCAIATPSVGRCDVAASASSTR